jgi:hypothetical protein
MIETVSEFLEEFRAFALKKIKLDDSDIVHKPTIGNIFEGLTSNLLNKCVFKGLGLKIVEKSFIYNKSGIISPEMDCLLVVGDGIQISFTNQFKYHVKNVVAVIQVKKNLYANDIDDSYQNLKTVIDISEPRQAEPFVRRLQRDSYKILTSKELPNTDRRTRLTEREELLYHFLMMEAFHPLRIVIGYYGYNDEYRLREGFVNKLQDLVKDGPIKGYSPGSFPNLIICGNNTIIKNNGMPIGAPLRDTDFYWPILLTSNEKPMYYLLELIWTRLSYKFEISSKIFGDDFHYNTLHAFLSCKERKIDEDSWGWEYSYHDLDRKQLSEPIEREEWKPIELTKAQYSVLFRMSKAGAIDLYNDSQLHDFLKSENVELSSFIDNLVKTKLVYVDEGKMDFLVDELLMTFTPEGKVFGGENKNGQMANYFLKRMKK